MPAVDVRLEVVTESHWDDIIRMRRTFLNSKHCCCFLPLGVDSASEVRKLYRKHPELMDVAAVAIVHGNVVGFIQVVLEGMPCEVHKVGPGEAYVNMIAVDPDTRGMGVGSALLKWADDLGKSKNCTYMALDVIRGNPAIGLYERKGYVVKPSPFLYRLCCRPFLCCLLGPVICSAGSPMYCSYGETYLMEKAIDPGRSPDIHRARVLSNGRAEPDELPAA
eukprot:jgi/Psemu1/9845/gm1.9845_g